MKKRVPLWLPYLDSIEPVGKDKMKFIYKGGEIIASPKELSSIMIYGNEVQVNLEVLENICRQGVPIIVHRRNVATPIWIHAVTRATKDDMLDLHLAARRNQTKCKHITRRLLEEKFKASRWLINVADSQLKKGMSIEKMRNIEAQIASRYWKEYMKQLGVSGGRRSKENEVKAVLDAVSKFTSGIILRWVTYHHLSPFHGFCHEPTDYPSLVYDLMEPYRPGIEKAVWITIRENPGMKNNELVNASITAIKEYLDEKVYTEATRQIVTRHELYHGIVLSLRSYLVGDSERFIIPTEGQPNGGRPRKIGYKLYGRSAGKTDFWSEANKVAGNHFMIKK